MSQTDKFAPWELQWEGKHIQRFWDWWGGNPEKSRLYFSRLVGDAILDEVTHHVELAGPLVDLGAGPGYFIEKFLERGIDTLAVDSSPSSVNLLNQRFQNQQHFLGAEASPIEKMTLKDQSANTVFLIETVEHLDDEVLSKVLRETYRILKPGGIIVITTPNEEDLPENQVMCPNCGCVFHTVQHVRSVSANSLNTLMMANGFKTIISTPTLFSWRSPAIRPIHRLSYQLRRKKLPHLLYIGKKQ